jgi:hypothetical protein
MNPQSPFDTPKVTQEQHLTWHPDTRLPNTYNQAAQALQ